MQRKTLWSVLSVMSVLSTLLASCAVAHWVGLGEASPRGSVPSGKITSSGFNCPEPNPRVQVSSTELNLYVWSTYVPTDFLECFRLVYGLEVKSVEYRCMDA